jgi:hypothetical protein
MTGFQMTGFKLIAATFVVSAAMAMPASSQAQAATGMKVAMAMPMHADGKMVRHGKRHMSHHMAAKDAAKDTAKDGDRYGMK